MGGIYVDSDFETIFFWKNEISEVSNIRQVSKIYSQIAEMLIHKIRDFGHDGIKFSNSSRRSKIIFIHRSTKMCLFEETA